MASNASGGIETFHFNPSYSIEVDPEFPADGDWHLPVFGFDREGKLGKHFESRWGPPLVIRVKPSSAEGWVGSFAAGGLGGVTGVFACPSPSDLCVLADGEAYLVGIDQPEKGSLIAHDQVGQVLPVNGMDLLLLVRFIDIVAIDRRGIAWRSKRLAVDDLVVVDTSATAITCKGDMLGAMSTIVLDPATGMVTEGPELGPPWN